MATPATSKSSARNHFIVASPVMQKFMGMVERVAKHVGTVLIVGETGTGKERIAHTIHEHSPRVNNAFVDINCAALPENLVESELFGYEKGAFSGADAAKPGLFEMAHQGTIFLDEIGELDLKVQVKLLRVLDRAPYYRLGGHRKITADVRVVAATNRNLKNEVIAGRFRKDLYHRLSQFELCVPPLRERREDVVALAVHFLAQEGTGFKFASGALRMLETYSWPGNVRELQNVVNKIMISASQPVIEAVGVRAELNNAEPYEDAKVQPFQKGMRLDGLEAKAIGKALANTGGHRGKAAMQLGISRRTLSRKLRHYAPAPVSDVAAGPLGVLSSEEQQDFRAEIRSSVQLTTSDGRELTCTAANLSEQGMGLADLGIALEHKCEVRIRFQLPDTNVEVHAIARLAWVDRQGNAGITFTNIEPAVRHELIRWLYQKMAEEGWTLQTSSHDISSDVSASPDLLGS